MQGVFCISAKPVSSFGHGHQAKLPLLPFAFAGAPPSSFTRCRLAVSARLLLMYLPMPPTIKLLDFRGAGQPEDLSKAHSLECELYRAVPIGVPPVAAALGSAANLH